MPELENTKRECGLRRGERVWPYSGTKELRGVVRGILTATIAYPTLMDTVGVAYSDVVDLFVRVGAVVAIVAERDDKLEAHEIIPLEMGVLPSLDPVKPQVLVTTADTRRALHNARTTLNAAENGGLGLRTAATSSSGRRVRFPGKHVFADFVEVRLPFRKER